VPATNGSGTDVVTRLSSQQGVISESWRGTAWDGLRWSSRG